MEQCTVVEEAVMENSKRAVDFIMQQDYINALWTTEISISVHGKKECGFLPHFLQGIIFSVLAGKTENADTKCTYRWSAVESFSMSHLLLPGSLLLIHCFARSLFKFGEVLNSSMYYKKAEDKAREGLYLKNPQEMLNTQIIPPGIIHLLKEDLKLLIKLAEENRNLDATKTVSDISNRSEENEIPLTKRFEENDWIYHLYWGGMSDESKRDFLIVDIKKFKSYVERNYCRERSQALEKALEYGKTNRNWMLWKCGTCWEEFHSSTECRKHLEHKHANNFRPKEDLVPRIVNEDCGEMISSGDWELLINTMMALNVIACRNASCSFKGWSNDFPLASDQNGKNILKELGQILNSLIMQKMLSVSLWDQLMEYAVISFQQCGVPKSYVVENGLDKKPQSFCFLELDPLKQTLAHLRHVTTCICTDNVSREMDGFWKNSRVKENIFSDKEFSCLILDNRLLIGEVNAFDNEGIIKVCAPSDHSARVSPQGDDFISWMLDCAQIYNEFVFQTPIMVHNLDIWLAVLRIIECECRTLETKYKSKLNMQPYYKGLAEVQRSLDQWKAYPPGCRETYASLLFKACQNRVEKDGHNSDDTIGYLSVVRDVVEAAKSPRLEVLKVEEYLKRIHDSYIPDDSVMESLWVLKTLAYSIDTEILVHENYKNQLLDDLTKLSMFDYRLVILPLLKPYLQEKLVKTLEIDAKEWSETNAEERLEMEEEIKKHLMHDFLM